MTIGKRRDRPPPARGPRPARLLAELIRLKTQFDGAGRSGRAKLALLHALRGAPLLHVADLLAYHDLLLFLRAYPDDRRIMAETERQLRGFTGRVEACKKASRGRANAELADSGIVNTTSSDVFSHEMAWRLSRRYGRRVDIDWDAYAQSDSANLLPVVYPFVSWSECDGIENDDDFDPQAWLQLSRGRGDANTLAALLTLLDASQLPRRLVRELYEAGGLPVRWDLAESSAARTHSRLPCTSYFFQREPIARRTQDLRAELRRPAPPLRSVSRRAGETYVRAIREALAVRCRELHPLTHANPDEVYCCDIGRGVRIVIYGCTPDVRLPLESNFGAMLVRNGVPVGYGVGAVFFGRSEIAINIFPSYRGGESAFIIEGFFRVFVQHFGARVLLVRSYQVGDDNEEALESGAFWFYYKLGFRPVKAHVRTLAEMEWGRLQAEPGRRSSLATLKRLARSDLFLALDQSPTDAYEELSVADLGYAVTRQIARRCGGRRPEAELRSMKGLARTLRLQGWRSWTLDEIIGFRRLAPLLVCIPGLGRWAPAERRLLARVIRAKGARRERPYALLLQRHLRLREALRGLARVEATRRART